MIACKQIEVAYQNHCIYIRLADTFEDISLSMEHDFTDFAFLISFSSFNLTNYSLDKNSSNKGTNVFDDSEFIADTTAKTWATMFPRELEYWKR